MSCHILAVEEDLSDDYLCPCNGYHYCESISKDIDEATFCTNLLRIEKINTTQCLEEVSSQFAMMLAREIIQSWTTVVIFTGE